MYFGFLSLEGRRKLCTRMENVCWWECVVPPLGCVLAASCSLVVAGLFWVCFGWKSSQLTLIPSCSRENMHTRICKSVPYFIVAAVIL